MSIIPLIGIFEFLPATNLEREANFKAIALIGSGKTLIAQSTSVALAFAGFSYMSIAYGQVAAAVFTALAYNIVGRRYSRFNLSLKEWRRIGKFGLQMLAISGVNTLGSKLSDVLLGRLVGLSGLGLYGRATALNSSIQDNIYMVIVRVLFVDIANQTRSGTSLRPSYLKTIDILTAILWPAFSGLAVISGPFIYVVYGSKWVAAAPVLRMLSISSIILVTVSLSWELFVVRQATARQTRIEFIRAGVGVALFGFGCMFGLVAAAAARIGGALFTVVLYKPYMDSMTDTRTSDFIPIYWRSALLTFVAIFPATVVMSLHNWSPKAPLIQISLGIMVGVFLWLCALMSCDHLIFVEIKQLFKRAMNSKLQAKYK
jgi:O-antigen/teichoic acid export membrane protein